MCRSALLVALLLLTSAARAEPFDFPPHEADARAPVVLDGHELLRVGGVSALPAGRRAAAIRLQLEQLIEDESFDPEALHLRETQLGWQLIAGEKVVMHVTDADAQAEGVSTRVLAEVTRSGLARAIQQARDERTPEALRAGFVQSLVATLLLLLLFLIEVWSSRRLDARMERLVAVKLERLQVDPFRRETADRLLRALKTLVHGLWVIVGVVALVLWMKWVLGRFAVTREVAFGAQRWLAPWFERLGESLVKAIPKLMVLLLIVWATVLALRWLTVLFRGLGSQTIRLNGFDPDWAAPTMKLLRMGLVAFAVVMAYPFIPGSETAAFKGISIFVGVVFSLSSTTAVTNVIAGYMLAYRRPFKPGDVVRIKEVLGEVIEVRLLVTRVRTPKNEEVIVPNSMILDGEVTNYSALCRNGGVVLTATVGLGYDVPWRQVEAMLLEAASQTPGFLRTPEPYVLQRELGEIAILYELNAPAADPRRMDELRTALHRSIQDVFNRYGVQMMTPHYVADPPEPKLVPPERWHLPPAPPAKVGSQEGTTAPREQQ